MAIAPGSNARGVTITAQRARELVNASSDAELYPGFFDAAKTAVERYAPSAPAEISNRAVLMLIEYWDWVQVPPMKYERTGDQASILDTKLTTNGLRHSGAMALLSPFKKRRAL